MIICQFVARIAKYFQGPENAAKVIAAKYSEARLGDTFSP
jgi:hypothetical protein